ncbi:MAG: hypothetical protein PHE78_03435 [Candidatus Gastranaerophilales bacterium]|nr:hypothetical protein [Candidatus Gastranaerophilales bacterium]
MTARMINQFDVPEVKFASSNWQLTYQGDKGNLVSKLEKVDNPMRGNFVEFETTNEKLVESVLDSTNYFYHPQNPDFKNLTFENDDFAFKFFGLGQKKKGNLYMTQRFEYQNKEAWDNSVEDMTLIFKRKPTKKGVIEPNRDRTKITSEEITKLSGHFAATMDDKQLAGAISSLQEVWSHDNFKRIYGQKADPDKFASMLFLKGLLNEASSRNIQLDFRPDSKFVAVNSWDRVSEDVLNDLRNQGYSICDGDLRKVGMDDIKTVMTKLRNHGALPPTTVESQKIQIIDEAARAIVESMQVSGKKNIITPDEVSKPVYLFSRPKNDDTLAEAITKYESGEGKQYKGHWIARDYLNAGDFSDVLATRLHETCHKYGGDESAIFSYKLTDLISDYNEVMTSDPKLRTKLSTLKKLWNDITPKENK